MGVKCQNKQADDENMIKTFSIILVSRRYYYSFIIDTITVWIFGGSPNNCSEHPSYQSDKTKQYNMHSKDTKSAIQVNVGNS